jgi:hypothetical protein
MGFGSWIRDSGSGIQKKPIPDPGFRIPDPGVKKARDPRSGAATLVRDPGL